MFSANENIMLRQHKRRVIGYIESTIPENALDLGTSVMAMQVSCRQPGCVPLETAVTIVFPKPPRKKRSKKAADAAAASNNNNNNDNNDNDAQRKDVAAAAVPVWPKPLIPDLEESRIGGSFKTRILKPLSDVTQDDVLDALPPSFEGGRRTTESLCSKARDMTFAQIGQLVGNDDTTDSVEGRRLVAEYLKACLDEYVERGCVAPEWGEPFTPLDDGEEKKDDMPTKDEKELKVKEDTTLNGVVKNLTMDDKYGKGNIVFRRPTNEEDEDVAETTLVSKSSMVRHTPITSSASVTNNNHYTSSEQLLQQMAKSEHAPGIRRAGCPCCDPDSASNYVDQMMGL